MFAIKCQGQFFMTWNRSDSGKEKPLFSTDYAKLYYTRDSMQLDITMLHNAGMPIKVVPMTVGEPL